MRNAFHKAILALLPEYMDSCFQDDSSGMYSVVLRFPDNKYYVRIEQGINRYIMRTYNVDGFLRTLPGQSGTDFTRDALGLSTLIVELYNLPATKPPPRVSLNGYTLEATQ